MRSNRSRRDLVRELRALGYQHVTIDLQGYRLGSLNEVLRLRPVQYLPGHMAIGEAAPSSLFRRFEAQRR